MEASLAPKLEKAMTGQLPRNENKKSTPRKPKITQKGHPNRSQMELKTARKHENAIPGASRKAKTNIRGKVTVICLSPAF